MNTTNPIPDLEMAFDVGHGSIGWAVFQNGSPAAFSGLNLRGCGVVIFGADDCLAKQRRDHRRQRRHIRATRQRIRLLWELLAHLGVLTPQQLERPGCAWPWFLAGRVLRGGSLLSWPELWDVLRWYAHNRGYDANRRWSRQEPDEREDAEKVENARALYQKYGTQTMAETFCAVCGLDPLGSRKSSNVSGPQRPRGLNAAFPREDVEAEVRRILERHSGHLPGLSRELIEALLQDWRAIPCPGIVLPARYQGGLLFGQRVPRFDNRIIGTCPIIYERVYQQVLAASGDSARAAASARKAAKVPSRNCVEFHRFRWAMQLANVQVATGPGRQTRPLTVEERGRINKQMEQRGFLTPAQFKDAVRQLTGKAPDNLDQMLMHPDAQETLVLDPVKKLIRTDDALKMIWPGLKKRARLRAVGQWRRGKTLRVRQLLAALNEPSAAASSVEGEQQLCAPGSRRMDKNKSPNLQTLLDQPLSIKRLKGRAPYTREVMRQAWEEVLQRGLHPKEQGGCLYRDEAIRQAQLQRALDEQTNNHLVRHRLRILERLHADILREYAGGDRARVARLTLEVNRELREFSGMTRKEQEKELGQRLAHFKSVVKKLEQDLAGKDIKITPGLIRKARVAEDLGWTCPYTGKQFEALDLLYRKVDKDHIIPRSDRASDSLDSLVITFAEVNRMKGKRTALQFIEQFQGRPVEGTPHLTIRTLGDYKQWVENLDSWQGHLDDKRRKKRRKELLLLRDYVEPEFTPRDLTQTSQLVRLAAQVFQREYLGLEKPPVLTSLPGSVTGLLRKGWDLPGCLVTANPQVLDTNDQVRTKTEIRDITHLHHALDACVLGLTGHFIPRDGHIWQLLVKRDGSLSPGERQELLRLGLFDSDSAGRRQLRDLPTPLKEQLRLRLAERRVVQHIPADMTGLPAEETVWRVFDPTDPHPSARRLARWFQAAGVAVPDPQADSVLIVCRKRTSEPGAGAGKTLHQTPTWRWVYDEVSRSKLIGPDPAPGSPARLKRLKAAKILRDNYGLALDPEPRIIRFHKVWHQLQVLRRANGGTPVRVLRTGQLIRVPTGRYAGLWRVFSVKAALTLNLGAPDKVRLESKGPGVKRDVRLKTLLHDGLQLLEPPYTGIAACPTTSST